MWLDDEFVGYDGLAAEEVKTDLAWPCDGTMHS